jgi:prepilin-type N-terminal cleavage/methylation domain-containing protein
MNIFSENKRQGFTLIELLVVIAIIGILSAVVLASLNTARNKGKDARVISSVQQIRTLLEVGYNGALYEDLSTTANQFLTTGPNYTNINSLVTDAANQGGLITLISPTSRLTYAIYGRLPSSPTTAYRYFCIDSTGKTNPAATAATASTCP